MKRRIVCATLAFVLLFSTIFFTGIQMLGAQETPVIYVDPSTIQVVAGFAFSINVSVANVADLQGLEFKLGFNATLLNATACYKVTDPPGTVWLPVDPEDVWRPLQWVSDGFVWVACVYPLGQPQTGNFTIVTISFTALATGNSTLHLYDTILGDTQGEPIAHTTLDGWVEVIGIDDVNGDYDVNDDHVVNVLDMILVLTNVGPVPPRPPECDVNDDNKIDVLDVILVLTNLGPV